MVEKNSAIEITGGGDRCAFQGANTRDLALKVFLDIVRPLLTSRNEWE